MGQNIPFDFLEKNVREEEKRASKLLYSILGVLSVGICRAKSESSSTKRGPRVGTKNEGFHRRSKGGDFGLGRLPTCATTLQEVGILPTLVYFHHKGCFGSIATLRAVWLFFFALRGCLA